MQSRPKSRRTIRAHGQHMLISEETADRFVNAARIENGETVLEIGTGTGMITKRLCGNGEKVVSYEIDLQLFENASRALSSCNNLELRFGDAFDKSNQVRFDVCVTSLPYSESLRFLKWLSLRSGTFRECIAILQLEFAEKLYSKPGKDSYRAVSVIAQNSFEIESLFSIQPENFWPPPRVLSKAIKLTPKRNPMQPFFDSKRISLANQLFSFRGRLLSSAIKKLVTSHQKKALSEELLATRVEDLTPEQISDLTLRIEEMSA